MADSDDIFDGDDAGGEPAGGAPKKRGGGLGNLLPTILKFVAIGIGAMIFIVTVCIITYNFMQRGGKSQTELYDPDSPYIGTRPVYSYFDQIGQITTRTSDFPIPATVNVQVIIGYDLNDQAAGSELNSRRFELRDYLRNYFSKKSAADLTPEKEDVIKKEIKEELNQRILDTAKVRDVFFDRFDIAQDAI